MIGSAQWSGWQLRERFYPWLAMLLLVLISGCAHFSEIDPYESMNRKIFTFNSDFDKNYFRPATVAYVAYVPSLVRSGIRNMFSNFSEVGNFMNNTLQLSFGDSMITLSRFLIKSFTAYVSESESYESLNSVIAP